MQCKICNKEYKNLNGLSAHITKSHKEISQQEYYDTFMKPIGFKNICPTCGKRTPFISIGYGYKVHCDQTCSNKNLDIVKQRHDTINLLHGGHALCFKEVQDKCKQTCFEKYGVKNPYQILNIKEKSHSTEALEKHYNTMKKNNTFKTSKQEDDCFKVLTNVFNTVYRNYKCDKYPFRCDFYIKDIDCFVECNFHWTHGNHWFNKNSKEDLDILSKWNNSNSQYIKNAINTWTIRDVNKRQYAKQSNLNYVVLWHFSDFENWANSNFIIRKDF